MSQGFVGSLYGGCNHSPYVGCVYSSLMTIK